MALPYAFRLLVASVTAALTASVLSAAPAGAAEPGPPACTVAWDGGAGSNAWRDAANWTDDRLPGVADAACLYSATAPAAVRLTGGDVSLAALRSETRLEVALDPNAGLALGGPSTALGLVLDAGALVVDEELRVTDVVQSGGEVSGPGDLVATGSYQWDGGIQGGAGRTLVGVAQDALGLSVTGGGSRSVEGRDVTATSLRIGGGADLELAGGALTATDLTVVEGSAEVAGTGAVALQGRLRVPDAARLRLTGDTVGLSANTTLGTAAVLSLAGAVTVPPDTSVAGAGALEITGTDTAAELAGEITVGDLTVDGAGATLEQDVMVETLTVTGGTLDATGAVLMSVDTELDHAHVTAKSLTATGTLTLGEAVELTDADVTAESLAATGASTVGAPVEVTDNLFVGPDGDLVLAGESTLPATGLVGGRLTLDGAATVTGEIEAVAPGTVAVGRHGDVRLDHGDLGGEGTTLRVDGTVRGNGIISGHLVNAGTLRLDDLPLTVLGDLVQEATGTIELTDPVAGGVLAVAEEAAIDGTLAVSLPAGSELPAEGLVVVQANPVRGEFSAVTGLDGCTRLDHDDLGIRLVPLTCFRLRGASGFEGDAARVRVQLSQPATAATTLTWRLTAGTATSDDWEGPPSGQVTVPSGARTAYVAVPLREDDAEEADETFSIEVVGDDLAGATADVTVLDDHVSDEFTYVSLPRLGRGLRPLDLGTASVVGEDVPLVGESEGWSFDVRSGERSATAPYFPRGLNSLDAGVGVCVDRGCVVDGDTRTFLARPAQTMAYPVDLTDAGLVAGWLNDAQQQTTPVTWAEATAQPVPVALPAGVSDAIVADVSERGQVVGTGRYSGVEVAWTSGPDGTDVVPVPSSYGADVVVAGVDESGVVAGHSVASDGRPHGWRWAPGSDEVQDLGAGSFVYDVTADGQLAGGVVAADGATTAQVWRGRWTDLDSALGDLLSEQYDGSLHLWKAQLVNEQGTLVVEGTAGGQTRTGVLLPPDAGCRICVDAELEEAVWPDPEDFAPAGTTVTEGNPVRVATSVTNRTQQGRSLLLTVTGPGGEVLGRHDVDLAPGQTVDLDHPVDVDGLAWEDGHEHAAVDLEVEVTGEGGAVVGARALRTAVAPRPVVMVHGMNSDASTWAAYPAMLEAAHSRWRGFAVDTLRTGLTDSVPLPSNAAALAAYIEKVQEEQDAFQVDLLAHSMGGLISRYFLHHTTPDPALPRPVRRLVMLGTPNAGSYCADLFAVPMTAPLRTDTMARFNTLVTVRRGVPFSVGYGNVLDTTCGESGPSDSVVSAASARTGVTDAVEFPVWHTDMTKAQPMFDDYVLPRLDGQAPDGQAAPATRTSATAAAAPEQPQVLARDTAVLAPHDTWTTQVPVPSGATTLGLTALGDGVTVGLARGSSAVTSEDERSPFPTAKVDDPAAGTWTVTVRNDTAEQRTVPVTTWVAGTPEQLRVTARRAGLGAVRVSAVLEGSTTPLHEVTAQLVSPGGEPVSLDLADAGDGIWSGTATGVRVGTAVVDVHAARPGFSRHVSTSVDVAGAVDGPGDDAPEAWDGEVTVPGGSTSLLPMDAADPEGAQLVWEVVDQPEHGRLGGTTAPFSYLPATGYEGPDRVTWRVSDGQAWSRVATTSITVGRVPTDITLAQPRDGDVVGGVDRTVSVAVRRTDTGSLVERGTVTYRLGDQEKTKDLATQGVGVTFAVPAINGRLPLTVTYSGTDGLAPSTFATELRVTTGTAPAPELWPVVGEAGYPVRVVVRHHDVENDVTRVEYDWQGDGTWDTIQDRVPDPSGDVQRSVSYAEWTYPAAVQGGTVKVRVTDGSGHVVTTSTSVDIAPHRPLGALRRLTVDGRPVQALDLSSDGRYVLYRRAADPMDESVPGAEPIGAQAFVLDTADGTTEQVTVMPDGSPAAVGTERVVLSPDGRWAAFGHGEFVDGKYAPQVYLRDLELETTTRVSVDGAGDPARSFSLVMAVADGPRVLFASRAQGLDGSDPACLAADPACLLLYERDLAAGTTTRLSGPLAEEDAVYSWNGDYAVWAESDGRVLLRDGDASGVPLDLPADWDGTVDGVSDDGTVVTLTGETDGVFTTYRYAGGELTPLVEGADGSPVEHLLRAAVDATGSCTVFASESAGLVPGDTGGWSDVFLRAGGENRRLSVEARDGAQGSGDSSTFTTRHAISADGRWVAFTSVAPDLVPGDVTDMGEDTFLLHLEPGACGSAPVEHQPELTLAGPATGTEGEVVEVTGTATDSDGDPLTWTWSGDGVTGAGSRATVALGDGPGRTAVTATVSDGTHQVTRSWTVDVLNAPPAVRLGALETVAAGDPVPFAATVSDPGGDPVTCSAAFDDATGAAPGCDGTHTWTEPGRYRVTVTAVDDDGATASDSATVTVTARPVGTEAPAPGHLRVWVRSRQWQHPATREGRPKIRLVARVRSDQAAPLRVRGRVQLRVGGRKVTVRLRPKQVQLVAGDRRRLRVKLGRPAAVMVTEALHDWRQAQQSGLHVPGVRARLVFRVTWADGTRTREERRVQLR